MAHPMSQDEVLAFLQSDPPHTAVVSTVRADGRPHVAPVWFALDTSTAGADNPLGDIVFNTGEDTVKGRTLRRDPRVALCIQDERPPHAFLTIDGVATLSEEPDELFRWASLLGGRYLGADRAEELGRRNGVPGELLVRVRPRQVVGLAELAD
ncbi:MAG TPA: PPOX class F420-dependent oxidoreductase [Acidimicrobiales bacterium]|nr:PPOX class F420-dependent oxidoreductase [Acidimicrobiales bacterium]